MICFQILTWLRKQALLIRTYTHLHLFLTGRCTEIRRRSTHVMNISFEIRLLCHENCFPDQRFVTSALYNTSLMKGKCTETASSKTSPVTCQRKFNLCNCRNPTHFFIRRMIISHIWKLIHIIHLLHCKRHSWWILHHISFLTVFFNQWFCRKRICILILDCEAFGIFNLIFYHLLILWQFYPIIYLFNLPRLIDCACNKCNIPHCKSTFQRISHLYNGMFSHSIDQQIGTRIHQNRAF